MSKKEKYLFNMRYLFMFFLVVVLGTISCFYLYVGHHDYEEVVLEASSKPKIEYKVYLKENDYFETNYLEMGKTYISSLIDYIDINLLYNINFNDEVKGDYTYFIKGTLMANKESTDNYENTNYWSKEYILKEPQKIEFNNKRNINFIENIKINYEEYNKLLNEFKNEYSLNVDGFLKVELVIESNNKFNSSSKTLEIKEFPSLTIPLTEDTIEFAFSKEDNSKTYKLKDQIKINDYRFKVYRAFGLCFYVFSVFIFMVLLFDMYYMRKKLDKYYKYLSRIIKNYNSIIVTIKSPLKLKDYNCINVKNFEELLDAQSEIRMPINFYNDRRNMEATFTLFNGNMVWVYKIDKNKFKKTK